VWQRLCGVLLGQIWRYIYILQTRFILKGLRKMNELLTRCTGTRPAFAAATISLTRVFEGRSSTSNVCRVAANVRNAFTSAYWNEMKKKVLGKGSFSRDLFGENRLNHIRRTSREKGRRRRLHSGISQLNRERPLREVAIISHRLRTIIGRCH
jgi:hypothetical protein